VEEVVHHIDLGDGYGDVAAGELPVTGSGEGVVAGDVGEGLVLALEGLDGVGGVGGAGRSALGDLGNDTDQTAGLGEREWAEKECIHDGEDDDVGADAEREDQDGDDGKAAVVKKRAEGVTDVLQKDVEGGQAAGFAVGLRGLRDAAETDECLAASFAGRHAALDVFLDRHGEVRRHFFREVVVEGLFMEEGGHAVEELAEGVH
jgi:hypothetical protein